ncbi:uncharacterized protein LOC115784289 [Archocentrus centrarchus]|uniref:uncharacterized protein LOC115784289 n=1 Tax=Archocentrus centrarchus TaxID=63155 RepID=UPI0011E9D843|nr:uncharacterized protein LOC115784289 [Archocentrus centrarchus]
MHLKQKGYSFGVVLIYTITTIALPVSRCEPTVSSFRQKSHPPPLDDSKSVLTTESSPHPSRPEVGERPHLASRRGEGDESDLLNSEGVRDRHKPRQAEAEPVHKYRNCRDGKIKRVVHGKFFIPGHLERNVPTLGYQSDSSISVRSLGGQARLGGHRVSSTVESWQKLQPVVECEEDGMTLTVRRRRAVQLLLDRANESSVPLSQLPPQCGYSLQNTWKDLRLMARYDACHVTREDGSYVLPLLWRGTPVKMSCPASQIKPQAVGPSFLCCSPRGMTVKVHEITPLEAQRVNVRGEWTPLALLVDQCGYTLDKQDADTVIAAPFITCGITEKDGEYMLSLQIGKEIFTLVCPVSPSEDLPINTQPLVDSPAHLTRGTEEPMLGTLEPFPWVPPVYLAPPYYPHPTYNHNYASPKVLASYNTPSLPALTPETLPPVDSQPDYQPYYFYQIPFWEPYEHYNSHSPLSPVGEMEDLSQVNPEQRQNQQAPFSVSSEEHSATPTGFPAQVEAPHFQPLSSRDFNLYYHYYHHPKIPLSVMPQKGPDVSDKMSSTDSHKHEFSVQQSPPPVSDTTSYPYTHPKNAKLVHKAPALQAPYHLNPYLYYYYYFPHISRASSK